MTATDAKGQSVTLVDGDTAYGAAINAGIASYTARNPAGPVTGGLYSYYNSAYGQIQPDGTVKLAYKGTPVWLFIAPLIHYVNDTIGGLMSSRPTPNYTGCSYVVIVDAASGSLLTNWQHCTSSWPHAARAASACRVSDSPNRIRAQGRAQGPDGADGPRLGAGRNDLQAQGNGIPGRVGRVGR